MEGTRETRSTTHYAPTMDAKRQKAEFATAQQRDGETFIQFVDRMTILAQRAWPEEDALLRDHRVTAHVKCHMNTKHYHDLRPLVNIDTMSLPVLIKTIKMIE